MVLTDQVSTGSGSDRVTVAGDLDVARIETRFATAPGADSIIAIRG
jgi:hypothetical protein